MRLIPLLALLVSTATLADAPPGMTERVRGTLTAFDAHHVEMTTTTGQPLNIALTPKTAWRSVAIASPKDIAPDSYIGTAAVAQPDGTLKALEVHVFAPALRGSGAGHRPWEGADGNKATMTNGTVGTLKVADGQRLTVNYPEGEKTVVVPDGVPIVRIDPANATVLAAGAHVIVSAAPDEKGGVVALSVMVGKGGLVPPM